MKNTIKVFGLIVLVAVIGFSFAALSLTGCGGGDSGNPPVVLPIVPPTVAHYYAIDLYANRWSTIGGGSGEQWSSGDQIKLSDFTTVKPKQGDVLQFKISGVPDKELKYIQIQLFNHNSDWSESTWIGESSDYVDLSMTFNDCIIVVNISNDPKPNDVIYLQIINTMTIPANTPDGTVMATISNFSISLSGSGSGGGEEIPVDKPDNGGKTPEDGSVQGNTLMEQLFWLQINAQSNKAYTLTARADEAVSGNLVYGDSLADTYKSNITITLISSGGEKILSNTGFYIGSGVTLILNENITLQHNASSGRSVLIYKGALVMNDGAKIIGSTSSSAPYCVQVGTDGTFTMNGGTISGNNNSGVVVDSGTFIMNGGTISGNTNAIGAGVLVYGTFIMNGGEISGNTAKTHGGGVYVVETFTMNGGKISGNTALQGGGLFLNQGTFRISNGIVYGSDADTGKANTAPPLSSYGYGDVYMGSSLFKGGDGKAQYGMGSTWTDIPVITSLAQIVREATINVVNGVLQ